WVRDKQKRLEKIQEAKAELEAEAEEAAQAPADPTRTKHEAKPTGVPKDKAQLNFTDRDSRTMKTSGGYIQGYNCQAAADADSQAIGAQKVAPNGSDMNKLPPMLKQTRTNLKQQARKISADAGYSSKHNHKQLRRRHIRAYVATRGKKDSARVKPPRPPAGVG